MYVCGITVDDRVHLGHARSALAFDLLTRVLLACGYSVRYVRNFTDIDDKIIARARAQGVDPMELAERNIVLIREDLAPFEMVAPDAEPRVTSSIDRIIETISAVLDAGHAYVAAGSVYFDVRSWNRYGWVSRRAATESPEAVGDEEKRHPSDFALWKRAHPGDPRWSSPWGLGRPGWHIECTAMLGEQFGPTVDIHGGGRDLIFPHHENEAAQGEAASGVMPYARHWVHNGTVLVDGEKMAKSRGNGVLVSDALGEHGAPVIKFLFLRSHYRSAVDYRAAHLRDAASALRRLIAPLAEAPEPVAHPTLGELIRREPRTPVERGVLAACEALLDDLNTPKALAHLHEVSRRLGVGMPHADDHHRSLFFNILRIMGVLRPSSTTAEDDDSLADADADAELLELRSAARAAKDWDESDRLRNLLSRSGIVVVDTPQGQEWQRVPGTKPPVSG
jgi:cysteinyl-tRNA synthetase